MKKIMIMNNTLSGGGAEKVLQTLLYNLDYKKYDVTLYSMHKEEIKSNFPKEIHYKIVFGYEGDNKFVNRCMAYIKGVIFNKCSSRVFYKLFFHEKYDVEIAFIEGESTKIIAGSTNKKSKKYAWVHIDLCNNPWTSFLYKNTQEERKYYNCFDKVFCVSNSVREAFISKFKIPENKVFVQYNPINKEEIIKKAKEKCDIQDKVKLRLVSVGRLVEQKGYDRLLNIALKLKNQGLDFELIILGEGEERKNYEKFINENNLMDMVWLMGFKENPYPYMAQSDIFVCSSRSEGFSTVVSEAVVLGLPVISTDCAGIKELFGNEECGIIVENNEEALYEALYIALSNPKSLEKYREGSLRRGKNFSLQETMKEIEMLLDERDGE